LSVRQAWFYKWRDGDRSPRHARRAQLTAAIKQIFADRHDTYGSPRVTDDLREAGWRVSEKTVAKIMRELGLAARVKKRRKHTTRPGRGRWRAPDLIGRDFPASTVNQKWYGDGTEIPTDEGKLCSSLPPLPVDSTIRSLRPGRRRRGPWSPLRWPTRAPTSDRQQFATGQRTNTSSSNATRIRSCMGRSAPTSAGLRGGGSW
jgi:HTH-like domain